MKPPKRIGKPRSLAAQTNSGSEVSEERIAQLRQDAVPTAALSPDEARGISRAYGTGAEWSRDNARDTRSSVGRGPETPAVARVARTGDSAPGQHKGNSGEASGSRNRGGIRALIKRATVAPSTQDNQTLTDAQSSGSRGRAVTAHDPVRPREWGAGAVTSAESDLVKDPLVHDAPAEPVVQLSARRREKLAERKRLRLKRIFIAVATVVIAVLATWSLFFSPLFALQQDKIEVTGLKDSAYLTNEQVTESLEPWVGTRLPRLSEGALSQRLTSDYPIIKSVDLSRDFPRGATLTISLREPVACLMEADTCRAIDTEGVILNLSPEQTEGLPRLTLASGQDAAGDAATAMIDVLSVLPADIRSRVSSIEVSEASQITLNLSDGATVAWGTSGNNEFKAEVLGIILQQEASHYDVSAPTAPVTS